MTEERQPNTELRAETLRRLIADDSVSWHQTVAQAYDAGRASIQVEAHTLIDELKSKATGLADASGFNVTYDVPAGILHKLLAWRDGAFAASIQAEAQQQGTKTEHALAREVIDKTSKIQWLQEQLEELTALPKEWEGTGYNPEQMARLVNLYQQLQKDYTKKEKQLAEARIELEAAEQRGDEYKAALAEARAQAFREAAGIARHDFISDSASPRRTTTAGIRIAAAIRRAAEGK